MKISLFTATIGTAVLLAAGASAGTGSARVAAWRDAIARTPSPPAGGCFVATYPSTAWHAVACKQAPARPYLPRHGVPAHGDTVGNGHDYSADTGNITQNAAGAFPTVSGVRQEHDNGGSNVYSLQLNSGFMTTAACNGHGNCLSWEQFVYSSSSRAAFIQYWLINYGNTCPDRSWNQYQGSCYKNSAAVGAPQFAITKLGTLSLAGVAVNGGNDTLTLTASGTAYRTGGVDTVVDLATAWTSSEFNIVGDGGGSQANFNRGSSLTVQLNANDGSGTAPACTANNGTTGETNNLNLHACSTFGGSNPGISFGESN